MAQQINSQFRPFVTTILCIGNGKADSNEAEQCGRVSNQQTSTTTTIDLTSAEQSNKAAKHPSIREAEHQRSRDTATAASNEVNIVAPQKGRRRSTRKSTIVPRMLGCFLVSFRRILLWSGGACRCNESNSGECPSAFCQIHEFMHNCRYVSSRPLTCAECAVCVEIDTPSTHQATHPPKGVADVYSCGTFFAVAQFKCSRGDCLLAFDAEETLSVHEQTHRGVDL